MEGEKGGGRGGECERVGGNGLAGLYYIEKGKINRFIFIFI